MRSGVYVYSLQPTTPEKFSDLSHDSLESNRVLSRELPVFWVQFLAHASADAFQRRYPGLQFAIHFGVTRTSGPSVLADSGGP